MRVLLFGTFDHLHPGHRYVLERGLERGETWVVVARDTNVLRIKGHTPAQAEEERRRIIEETYPTIHAVLGDPEDFLAPVRTIKPDLILLGYDQKLPPGVEEKDLLCPATRLPAFEPGRYKSSLKWKKED